MAKRSKLECPECGEPAQNRAPSVPLPKQPPGREPRHSHLDGEPLCPVIGDDGYTPAQPRVT